MTRDRSKKIYNFELRLFGWHLIASLPLWVYLVIKDLILNNPTERLAVDLTLCLVTGAILYGLRFTRHLKKMIGVYCIVALGAFAYYWYPLGGYTGPISYFYFALGVLFTTLLPSRRRVLFAVVFCLMAIALTIYQDYFLGIKLMRYDGADLWLNLAYVGCSIVLALILVFLKRNFDSGRSLIMKNNKRLSSLSKRVENRQRELMNQREQIRSIKQNLEILIRERTSELEHKTKRLEKYAYDNAHHVRKPISNILGLLSVMEVEQDSLNINPEKLRKVKEHAQNLDEITQRINTILR